MQLLACCCGVKLGHTVAVFGYDRASLGFKGLGAKATKTTWSSFM